MFYHALLVREITLHPKYFGPKIKSYLEKRLHLEVEGSCDSIYGFIVVVTKILQFGGGEITIGQGYVTFSVKFLAVVFRPFKGEVLDALVVRVNNVGIFTEIGPMQVFVSRFNIPQDMIYEGSSEAPCYRTPTDDIIITDGDKIRVRLINVRVDMHEISAAGSIREDYLGKFS